MPGEVDPAVAAYMETRREEILSVIPQLEKALEKARREDDLSLIEHLTKLLKGDENHMTLAEFPEHQAQVISEVLWVADRLMAHAIFQPLLKRVGVHGDLMPAEMEMLEGHVKALLQEQREWTDRDWKDGAPSNAWTAIALVRRVLAGVYEDLRTPAAIEFIDYNAYYNIFEESSKLFKPIHCFHPHVEEVFFVGRLVARIPDAVHAMEKVIELDIAWMDLDKDEHGYGYIVLDHIKYILKKYGWYSKNFCELTFDAYLALDFYVRTGGRDWEKAWLDRMEESISHSFAGHLINEADWCTAPFARTWGPNHVLDDPAA